MARMAGQRKTGQRKVRYGSPQQAAPASAQKKKKKKSTQENAPELLVICAKTARAVLTTPGHAPLLQSVPVSGVDV